MTSYRVGFTRNSANVKTGPIPVSTTESKTCPPDCAQRSTCYAKFGPMVINWKLIDLGSRGMEWDAFCDKVRALPHGTLWRHNQAGDLPGDGVDIDRAALEKLVQANKGRRGFTYTHYKPTQENLALIKEATEQGFTVNFSCDNLKELAEFPAGPKVVIVPSTESRRHFKTEDGTQVTVCPATYREDITCETCEACYASHPTRSVIAFPAHGTKKGTIDRSLAEC